MSKAPYKRKWHETMRKGGRPKRVEAPKPEIPMVVRPRPTGNVRDPRLLSFQDGIRYCMARGFDFANGRYDHMRMAIQTIRACEADYCVPDRVMTPRVSVPQPWREEYLRLEKHWGKGVPSATDLMRVGTVPAGRPSGTAEVKPIQPAPPGMNGDGAAQPHPPLAIQTFDDDEDAPNELEVLPIDDDEEDDD
jgi:hypothetical protein